MRQPATTDFDRDLIALLPRLRIYALSLTHDRDRADDIVQETTAKALAGRASFRPGTNFAAWLFRIGRNEFISGLRRTRFAVPLDDSVACGLSYPPQQEGGLAMREFLGALRRLSGEARRTLLLAGVEGQCHKQIAEHCGVSVGTVKSRTCRARAALAQMLADEPGDDRRDHEDALAVRRPTARPSGSTRRPAIVTPPEFELTRGGDDVSDDMLCARAHGGNGRDDRIAPVAAAIRIGGLAAGRGRHGLRRPAPAPQLSLA